MKNSKVFLVEKDDGLYNHKFYLSNDGMICDTVVALDDRIIHSHVTKGLDAQQLLEMLENNS